MCVSDPYKLAKSADDFSASGLGQSMWQVILGRAISGSGGSGAASIGLVLVTGEFHCGRFTKICL